ncbi:putative DoxX family protein [Nocardia nova SH22a]|uniref:Putative DoxX family protein n=1 Tax=Nocardia nova SH22a TaxID=1415166 RepID=W5TG09_9NOCA|nr:DoxX family protein [Nocardia nova]AHH18147.1 putative DoxX family protein [Nocardia nova SH22a]
MSAYDSGLLLLRIAFGLTLAAHGYQKFFGGGRIPGTAAWFDSIGMKPGVLHARLAAGTEIAAGVGLALGLLTSFCAAAFVALMIVAGWTVHRDRGFFIVGNGWEYNFILAAGAAGLATVGPGRISLDHLLFGGGFLDGWAGLAISIGVGVIGAVAQLGLFYRPPVRATVTND